MKEIASPFLIMIEAIYRDRVRRTKSLMIKQHDEPQDKGD